MLGDISVFLLQALSSLILIVIMLRFLLQAVRANFRNPLAQAIVQLTSPLVDNPAGALADELARPLLTPIRRVIPPFSGFDLSPLFAMLLIGVIRIVVNHLHLMVRM